MAWLPQPVSMGQHTAKFTVLEGTGANTSFTVQFNPASLEYTIATEFDDRNGANAARQTVKKSTGKLTMTLVFDTTDTGADVCSVTANIAGLLEPDKQGGKSYAPKIQFEWGTYSFKGVVEQYKETIDFFSADGVPLRASINLTLSSQKVEFRSNRNPAPSIDHDPMPDPVAAPPGSAPSDIASAAGDPRAARSIASASGADSLRFGASAGLSVGGSVTLSAAADFSASAGLGISGGAGIGIGGGAGIGVGVSGGIGIGGGISAGAGVGIGGGLSISATAGESFTGLRVSPPSVSVSVDSARAALLPAAGVSGAASFGVGGRARVQGGGSLSADVGASADLNARIGFD